MRHAASQWMRRGFCRRSVAALNVDGSVSYEKYLQAVDHSLEGMQRKQTYEVGKAGRIGEGEVGHGRQLAEKIQEVIDGIDESVVKIKRVAEIFWIAHEGNVPLAAQTVLISLRFFLGFQPFPTKRVGFRRGEIAVSMYNHVKRTFGTLEVDMMRFVMQSIARSYPSHTDSQFHTALGIMKDADAASIQPTPRLFAEFFLIAGRTGNPDHAKIAYGMHLKHFNTFEFKASRLYYSYLLSALANHKLIDDALRVMNGFEKVSFDTLLSAVCMDVCAKTAEPLSAFSLFAVLFGSKTTGLRPTVEIYSVLLYAAAANPQGVKLDNVLFIVNSMSEHSVHTDDESYLNRLAISLFAVKQNHLGTQLIANMKVRDIPVWEVTQEAVPFYLQEEAQVSVLGAGYNVKAYPPKKHTVEDNTKDLPSDAPTWDAATPKFIKLRREATRVHRGDAEKADADRKARQVDKAETARRLVLESAEHFDPLKFKDDDGDGYDIGKMLGLDTTQEALMADRKKK